MGRGRKILGAIDRSQSQLSVGEYAVLGLLHERPMHGYEIAHRFSADLDLGLVLPLDMSTVYALLRELQEQGLIQGQRQEIGARPPRNVFRLTSQAEAQFLQWLEEPVERLREIRSALLVKLYFCHQIGSDATARLLDAQITASRLYLDRLLELKKTAEPGSFEELVRASKIGPARATIAWLKQQRVKPASATPATPPSSAGSPSP